jgi:hypothetical protein
MKFAPLGRPALLNADGNATEVLVMDWVSLNQAGPLLRFPSHLQISQDGLFEP